jgi:hypothetical protein
MTESNQAGARNSPLLIILAWVIVGVPWLWGFSQTVEKAAALFQ